MTSRISLVGFWPMWGGADELPIVKELEPYYIHTVLSLFLPLEYFLQLMTSFVLSVGTST